MAEHTERTERAERTEPSDRTGPAAPVTVLIVDDHPVVRDGLRGMFASAAGFEVLGEAGDGIEGVELATRLDPDVVLMDLRMPGGGGVAAIVELARRAPRCRVLVLTTYDTDSDTLPAIEAGATGYLLKDTPREELFTAVRAAAKAVRCSRPRSPPVWSHGSGHRATNRSAPASARSWHSSPRAPRTVRSPPCCSSARQRSKPI